MERLTIDVGGMTFSALADGPADGRLVILLHGFPQTSAAWKHALAALGSAGYRAVAPDQRGYSSGARPAGVQQYAMPHLVSDVLAIADDMGGHEFDLVGHDWGGAVAWQLAGRYPERLRTLTVVSTPHPAAFTKALRDASDDQSQRSWYMEFFQQPDVPEETFLANDAAGLRNIYAGSGLSDAEIDEYVTVLTQPGAMTAAINWYRAASIGDVEAMGPVTTPTLYVWSDQDIALGRRAADGTAECVSGPYRFEVLEGVSHWIPEQAPDRLHPLLLEHLAAHG
jgi:pimeloyl-ACP methyl ester carboxylesterase